MKIGIITITDGQNYGNRLQNFALQETLKKFGVQADTIKRLTFRNVTGMDRVKLYIKNFVKFFVCPKAITSFYIRKYKFYQFNKKYIHFSNYFLKDNHASDKLKDSYNFFICGSDQIWNPYIRIAYDDIENAFAVFAYDYQRISYAASFGISEIPEKCIEQYKRLINGMRLISVREVKGVDIVKKLTDKEAQLVLDPTMLLSKEEWIRIEKKPRWYENEKYILTYFLGGRNGNVKRIINDISAKNNLKIINLEIEFLANNQVENSNYYTASPEEFIYLIHHCDFMMTDSFHGSVFSIIFEKAFGVFERKLTEKNNNMSSRIVSLLSMFGLQGCLNNIHILNKVDYNEVKQILNKEKAKSIDYLLNAINTNNI